MTKKMFCLECNAAGKPKFKTKGSIMIEMILWCCFIIPGLIYSIWRQTTKYKVCPFCGAKQLIPLNSPKAERLDKGVG